MPFESLGLAPALALAAKGLGFAAPTPVQAAAIPAVLRRADVQAQAPTGTGKTAAYALPLLHQLLAQNPAKPSATPRALRALVLVPTRELAAQVGEVLRSVVRQLPQGIKVSVVFGGVSANPQMMALRGGTDVLVATPGRLLDLVASNALHLGAVQTLVLDEADRLLEMGFAKELQAVLALLPLARQNLFFSATFSAVTQTLAANLLREPECISLGDTQPGAARELTQRAIAVDAARRTQLVQHLVQSQGWRGVLVFVATQYATEHVAAKLYQRGVFATPFHGDMSQGARTQVLQELSAKRWDVVVTTDLAARGLDVPDLPVVINYDLPRSAADYLHRIGRTARAGAAGMAISLVSAATEPHMRLIEKRNALALPREIVEGFEPTEAPLPPDKGAGGIKGKRPSKKDKLRAAAAKGAAKPLGVPMGEAGSVSSPAQPQRPARA
jgi:ATP-dependent RNA helicase RhlE